MRPLLYCPPSDGALRVWEVANDDVGGVLHEILDNKLVGGEGMRSVDASELLTSLFWIEENKNYHQHDRAGSKRRSEMPEGGVDEVHDGTVLWVGGDIDSVIHASRARRLKKYTGGRRAWAGEEREKEPDHQAENLQGNDIAEGGEAPPGRRRGHRRFGCRCRGRHGRT